MSELSSCQKIIEELNRIGRLWDKNGVRLYPIIDRAVASVVLCREATDPADAEAILQVCVELTSWIDYHRTHLREMTDIVQTMCTNATIAVEHGHWATACGKEIEDGDDVEGA